MLTEEYIRYLKDQTLGPKLIITVKCINDIFKVSNILKFLLYVDDTNICSGVELQLLVDVIAGTTVN